MQSSGHRGRYYGWHFGSDTARLGLCAAGINSVDVTMTFKTGGNLTGFTDNLTAVGQGYTLGTATNLNVGVDTANTLK